MSFHNRYQDRLRGTVLVDDGQGAEVRRQGWLLFPRLEITVAAASALALRVVSTSCIPQNRNHPGDRYDPINRYSFPASRTAGGGAWLGERLKDFREVECKAPAAPRL